MSEIWRSWVAKHLDAHPTAVDDVIAAIGPKDLATLIYTSGTTGRPKGVRLVQDCWTYLGASVEAFDIISADDLQYLWLPLSHVFGKSTDRHPALYRFHDGGGWADHDKIVENTCGGKADVHVRRSADL